MDFLFELLFELIAEGTVELSKSIKVPKYIRYPLIVIIALFFIGVIGILLLVGVASFEQNFLIGIIIIALALLLLVMGVIKFRKTYLIRKNKN